jgi:hypothetical protein
MEWFKLFWRLLPNYFLIISIDFMQQKQTNAKMQQQRNMQFMSLQKPPQSSAQKNQQRQGPSGQLSGAQSQNSAVSMNMKTDQILNQLQTLACNTQAQTENTEKLQQRLHKSEETLESQKRQNQVFSLLHPN